MLKKLGLKKIEKLGIYSILLFIAGWIAMLIALGILFKNPKLSLKEKDIMRLLNDSIYKDAANVHLPVYVDKVTIIRTDSITPSGTTFYPFEFRIKSEKDGSSWHKGTVEEGAWMEFRNLTFEIGD